MVCPTIVRFDVHGNISSGKTQLLRTLARNHYEYFEHCVETVADSHYVYLECGIEIKVFYEPVEQWITSGMLQKFYSNEVSFECFQQYVLSTLFARELLIKDYVNTLLENNQDKFYLIFVERSLDSCLRFFISCGPVSDTTASNLKETVAIYSTLTCPLTSIQKLDIYVKTDVNTCYVRRAKRARVTEHFITEDYLTKLHDAHELYFLTHESFLTLDGTSTSLYNMDLLYANIRSKLILPLNLCER